MASPGEWAITGSVGLTRQMILALFDAMAGGWVQRGGGLAGAVMEVAARGGRGDFLAHRLGAEGDTEASCRGGRGMCEETQEDACGGGGDGAAGGDSTLYDACAVEGWTRRASPRRVFDCVNYFQEDAMLRLRMEEARPPPCHQPPAFGSWF